jgi:hypothetical protein
MKDISLKCECIMSSEMRVYHVFWNASGSRDLLTYAQIKLRAIGEKSRYEDIKCFVQGIRWQYTCNDDLEIHKAKPK